MRQDLPKADVGEAFRQRADELRRIANRPEPSSMRAALLAAAEEWDELAHKIMQRRLDQGNRR